MRSLVDEVDSGHGDIAAVEKTRCDLNRILKSPNIRML